MASYRGRRRPAAVPSAASTPVAAVTPTLAVSSGLLNDVTESEDEMESLAQRPVAPGRTTLMAATVSHSSEVGSAASGAQPSVDLIKLQCQVQQLTGESYILHTRDLILFDFLEKSNICSVGTNDKYYVEGKYFIL